MERGWVSSSAGPADLRVRAADAVLLVVDVQDRLAPAMPAEAFAALERNTLILLAAADRLGLPIAVSEQYPKGLGRTVPAIEAAIGKLATPPVRFEKLAFSAAGEPALAGLIDGPRRTFVVTGMETHICVYQSVRALVERGLTVHVPEDAVISRTPANHRIGLDLIGRAGAVTTSTETVVFDLLERAGTPEFSALARLVK